MIELLDRTSIVLVMAKCKSCDWQTLSDVATMPEATAQGEMDGASWITHLEKTGHPTATIEAYDPDFQPMKLIMSATFTGVDGTPEVRRNEVD